MSSVPSALFQDQSGQQEPETSDLQPQTEAVSGWRRGIVGGAQILGIVAAVSLAVGFSRADSAAEVPAAEVPAAKAPLASAPVATAAAPVAEAAQAFSGPLVTVTVPQLTTSKVTVNGTGSVVVRNRVGLVPEVSGRVVSLSPALRAGGSFAAGEELLRVDSSELRLALDQAAAQVAVARSKLRLQEAEAEAARINYGLVHPGKRVPALVAKVPQLDRSKAELAAAEASAAMAALELSRTRFSLPFAGKITSSTAEVGQMLSKGQVFGQAFSLQALEVAVPIAQDDLARLTPAVGRKATVTAGGVELSATVERVSAELDERTRFAKVYLTAADMAQLPPGTFVSVTLDGPEVANTFVLPEAAEQMNGAVWVVDNGELRKVQPQVVGRSVGGLIVEAFDAGEGIVLGSVPGGRDGLAVRTAVAGA
jgi:RND family efflux transporter MFP subunit